MSPKYTEIHEGDEVFELVNGTRGVATEYASRPCQIEHCMGFRFHILWDDKRMTSCCTSQVWPNEEGLLEVWGHAEMDPWEKP